MTFWLSLRVIINLLRAVGNLLLALLIILIIPHMRKFRSIEQYIDIDN
jgi:hypothetical protein